ncbi:MAG: hypothetical protein V4501_13005 [Pseudomonadota bacterium]
MKSLKKLLAILALGGLLVNTAQAADEAMYMPRAQNLTTTTTVGGVTVQNDSYDAYNDIYPDYTVYASYNATGAKSTMYLGPYGFTTDLIFYPITFPNSSIHFDIWTNDWIPYQVFCGNAYSGNTISVYYHNHLTKDTTGPEKPMAKVIKH